ncbi:MAG: hypothetical protein CBARDCOR_5322 [uncultured Caballeronia sp.]|nr:MAG: hypothetical protein CBARDCOR_5322 [uncultured Caballeronia sp.]
MFTEATSADLKRLFREGVYGTRDLPLDTLFEPFGIKPMSRPTARRRNRRSVRGFAMARIACSRLSTRTARRRRRGYRRETC